MDKKELTHKYINGVIHAEDLIDLIVEQANKIKKYEQYFKENSVESIQSKMDAYGEVMLKLMEEE